jgi:hypothetical protein
MERQGAMDLTLNRRWFLGLAGLALGVVSFACVLNAQDDQATSGQPARAVRLSYVDGQATLSQAGQVLAQQAVANTPLFEGMQLTTADSGKAEIQFEDGSVARISPDSSLTLAVLRGSGASADAVLLVNSGLAYFEFQGGGQAGQMSVQFGNAAVTASGFTVFRVDMDNLPGKLAVFSGNAHLQGANGAESSGLSVDLRDGESVTLSANDPSQYNLADSIEPDSWDAWNSDRDQALTSEAANQTGAPAGIGASESPAWNDLDANGNWYNVPNQGYVWSPYDAANADFDPYGYGSWMWTPGFGYLWASGYPWGYMPFQCGMWNFYSGFGWGWAPGMGGCSPWWGAGMYGGPNIGYAPPGYRGVARPLQPRHPLNGRPLEPIVVNRRTEPLNPGLPQRDKTRMVTIAGRSVLPLTALSSRPGYNHPTYTMWNRGQGGIAGARPAAGQGVYTRPGYLGTPAGIASGTGNRGVQSFPAGGRNSDSQNRNSSQPSRSYSQPSRGSSAPAASSGGGGYHGGGAQSAPSGGGGGGGGGGSHGGGGGGGGSHH